MFHNSNLNLSIKFKFGLLNVTLDPKLNFNFANSSLIHEMKALLASTSPTGEMQDINIRNYNSSKKIRETGKC